MEIAIFITNALASLRTIATAAGAATARALTAHAGGYLPRHLRLKRRAPDRARRVERVVIDDWLIWRG